jgi:tetratricopeptide (TPR) repeat protein
LTARLQKEPKNSAPWLLLGAVRLELKNSTGASEAWQRFLKDTPVSVERQAERDQALMGLAQISLEAKRETEAETWLAQVGAGDQQLRARSIRAAILGRKGQIAQGRDLIRSTRAVNPKQVRERTLAEVQFLRQFKLWQSAYDTLTEAVQALEDEDDEELSYELAMATEKVGRFEQAEALLRELIERNPRFHHAYNALGYSLAERNERLDEARALIVKALEMAPEDPFITDSLGWVEFRRGRLPEAQAILRRAFETRPDAEIAAHLGEVLWVMGEKEKALQVWRQGLRLADDNDTLNETLQRLGAKP